MQYSHIRNAIQFVALMADGCSLLNSTEWSSFSKSVRNARTTIMIPWQSHRSNMKAQWNCLNNHWHQYVQLVYRIEILWTMTTIQNIPLMNFCYTCHSFYIRLNWYALCDNKAASHFHCSLSLLLVHFSTSVCSLFDRLYFNHKVKQSKL